MHNSVPKMPGILANENMARVFRLEVAQMLDRKSIGFPGAQPVSFERKHLDILCQKDFFLCEKTDGIRCLLYCTTSGPPDDFEIHYLIDRKNQYYFIRGLHFPHHQDPTFQQFHTNTILDGELVLDTLRDGTQVQRFLVFDCLILDDELLKSKTFDKRIGRYMLFVQKPLDKFLKANPQARRSMPFEVMSKIMDKPYALDDMFSVKLPSLPHGNDGLVFTAKDDLYTFGTDEMILKWKPANENSVDFKLQLGPFPTFTLLDGQGPFPDYDAIPVLNLCIFWGKNDYRKFAQLHVTDEEWEAVKSLNQQVDGRIIECYLDSHARWRFKQEHDGTPRFRDDKLEANHVTTMRKVIQSIQDGVSEQQLRDASFSIKEAWKARHPEERKPRPVQKPQ